MEQKFELDNVDYWVRKIKQDSHLYGWADINLILW